MKKKQIEAEKEKSWKKDSLWTILYDSYNALREYEENPNHTMNTAVRDEINNLEIDIMDLLEYISTNEHALEKPEPRTVADLNLDEIVIYDLEGRRVR